MLNATLAAIAKPLASVATAVWPHARRVYQERQAGRMPFVRANNLLERNLDETFVRLRGGDLDDAWWRNLLNRIEHSFVAPDFLRKPALQEWLAERSVEADFKALVRERLMGANTDDQGVRARLRRAYAESTGEDERLADGPIDVVIAVLAAGYLTSIGPQLEPVVGMIQAGAKESRAAFGRMDERFDTVDRRLGAIGPDQHVIEAHTDRAARELSLILKRRSLEPSAVRQEIRVLAQRVRDDDFRHADPPIRTDILYWAARLHASQAETLPDAKNFRDQLREVDPNTDTRIIDALILQTEGDVDGALRILRDVDYPDGRAALLLILSRTRGDDVTLTWFDEQPCRDDPDFLTGIGWSNVAVTLAQAGRWEEAAARLAAAGKHISEWPDLAFIEGVVNAAMLLPVDFRRHTLQMNLFHRAIRTIEGPDADRIRARAHDCFTRAADLMDGIGHGGRARAAQDWCLWLRLTDPRPEIVEAARQEVHQGMKDGRRAVDLLPFACAFDIEFDDGPVRRYLTQSAHLGGLEGRELGAELMLAEVLMAPGDLAAFLEREEGRLAQVVPEAVLTGMRIEALVEDGQPVRARRVLGERGGDLAEHDYDRLRVMIDAHEGDDPRAQLEELYKQTNSLIDLQNLIGHLGRVGDWTALRPLLEELFRRERTIENALRLVACLRRDPGTDETYIVSFLAANQDLVDRSHFLASAKAWALIHMGHWEEAKAVNDGLLRNRDEPNDLELDINLALQSGDWERFPVIVEREWSRRDRHEAGILIRLASLASEVDATAGRALELAELAVGKSPDNPQVLMSAYALAVQLGREERADIGWIGRAAELSSDAGPVRKVNLRTIIEEMVPAHREHAGRVEQALLRGEIPLHVAAALLNVPLSRVLLALPTGNVRQQDGRRRVIVPIVSGARRRVQMQSEWTVGFDATSLMVFAYLGLLRSTLAAFRRVVLAPDTMLFLLKERRSVRFHQPSRVRAAEEVHREIDQTRLAIAQTLPEPPQWLADEVGRDLAQLLEAARAGNGRVVRPRPIHKLSTFMEREAELGDYAELVLPITSFAHMLFEKGYIDAATHERTLKYLVAHDRDQSTDTDLTVLDRPLYLDDLAVTYLQGAGLLQAVCDCGIDVQVHPSTRAERDALVAANREGERLADMLSQIRETLRDALETGKAIFLQRNCADDEETALGTFAQVAPTLAHFLRHVEPCDVVCIDDRFVNKYATLTDRTGRTVPVVCVLDVLRHLQDQDVITTGERHEKLHKLRQGGFALVPLEPDELELYLRAVRFDQEDCMIEGVELRVARQTLMRVRSLDMLDQRTETLFLDGLRLWSVLIIRRLWEDEELPAECAAKLSDWTWRNVAASPLDWARTVRDWAGIVPAPEAFTHHVALLLKPIPPVKGERHKAFRRWIERAVLEPLLPANASLVDSVAALVRHEIEELITEFGDDAESAAS